MNFDKLKDDIQQLSNTFQQNAVSAVNTLLTMRNWLIGLYIVEFEQQGEDRATYGAKLLQNLADELNSEGLSYRNLKLYRQFYVAYPQIRDYLPEFFQTHLSIWYSLSAKLQFAEYDELKTLLSPTDEHCVVPPHIELSSHETPQPLENKQVIIWQSVLGKLQPVEQDQSSQHLNSKRVEIGCSVSAQFKKHGIPYLPAEKVLFKLSFTHIKQLLPIDNLVKRLFYEMECIKGTWSVRELKRQIDSLYFERSEMSGKPELLSQLTQKNIEPARLIDTIKSPFVFEFLGLKAKDVVYESDLEQALIEHLEEFLMELGDGFCFEARQKRILIGDEYYFCDLVFYHRVLKCHILIELKLGNFQYEHIGQLKTYINYYKKEIMRPDDNPPVGILLVTNKDSALVEYAFADSDRDIFVSKYIFELPPKEQLERFILNEYAKM
jgi:predicted nuclease of restriction endonuclease-like (RecB) superfamily